MTLAVSAFIERADEELLAQLTDNNHTTINETKVARALEDAWNEIQGYLYDLDSSLVPPDAVLESHQFDLAMYRLASARPGEEFESMAARYKSSIRYLEGLRDPRRARQEDNGVVATGDEPTPIFEAEFLAGMGGES